MTQARCSDQWQKLDKALAALQQAVADIRQAVAALAAGKKEAIEELEREWRERGEPMEGHRH